MNTILECAYTIWAISAILPSPDIHFQVYANSITITCNTASELLKEFHLTDALSEIAVCIGQN